MHSRNASPQFVREKYENAKYNVYPGIIASYFWLTCAFSKYTTDFSLKLQSKNVRYIYLSAQEKLKKFLFFLSRSCEVKF